MKCPVCKKEFDVLWPSQWAYKRGNKFICSWGCIRKYDRKEANGMYTKTKKDGTPAKKPGPKAEPKVELVYDESIAEEYRREQEAKKAEDPLVYEIPIRKERVNIGPARLPIASVWSRAMEMGTFTKVQGIGMMLKDPECQILMSRAKWEELADEIRVALEMLEV